MRKGDTHTLLFAAAVCVGCSLLLASAAAGLRGRQERMAEVDRKRNVLKAFKADAADARGRPLPADAVERLFAERVERVYIDAASGRLLPPDTAVTDEQLERRAVLPLYRWTEGGRVTRYAFPISGKGLWSTIYGYLALESDLATIAGITFYRHGETPGLGGEIEQPWFQRQFEGKKVYGAGRLLPFEIVKGTVAARYPDGNEHAVDGISGASLTGKGVTRFLNEDLARYETYFRRIRGA